MSNIIGKVPDLKVNVLVPDPVEGRITRTLSVGGQSYKGLIDKTESVIPAETGSGVILIIDSSGTIITGTDKFMVQQVSEQFEEKVQVSETLQEDTPALFMFGSKTVPCSFALKMLDTASANKGIRGEWYKGFQLFWEDKLRASKLFKDKRTAVMLIDNEAIFGYPISMSLSKNSQEEFSGTIVLNWLVLDRQVLFNDVASLWKYMDILNQKDTWLRENTPLITSLLDFLKVFSKFDSKETKSISVLTPLGDISPFDGTYQGSKKDGQLELLYKDSISFLNNGIKTPLVVLDSKSGKYEVNSALVKGNLSFDRVKQFLSGLSDITGFKDLVSEFESCDPIRNLYNNSGTWSSSGTTVEEFHYKVKIAIDSAMSNSKEDIGA